MVFLNYKIEPLIDELDFGDFEGLHKSKIIEETKGLWIERPRKLLFGESLVNFEKRLKTFLLKYSRFNALLVLSHGTIIRGLMSIKKKETLTV